MTCMQRGTESRLVHAEERRLINLITQAFSSPDAALLLFSKSPLDLVIEVAIVVADQKERGLSERKRLARGTRWYLLIWLYRYMWDPTCMFFICFGHKKGRLLTKNHFHHFR